MLTDSKVRINVDERGSLAGAGCGVISRWDDRTLDEDKLSEALALEAEDRGNPTIHRG